LAFFAPTTTFLARARQDLATRLSEKAHEPTEFASHNDLLTGLLAAQAKHPDTVDDTRLAGYVVSSYLAGSDTTAIVLRSILYYTLRTPGCLERLREELKQAGMTSFPVRFEEARELKYLDAVIREAMRIHFVVSFALERVVPPEKGPDGWTMPNGVVLPVGTQVSFTGWTLAYDEQVYGPETKKFKPERWLKADSETDVEFDTRLVRMLRNDLTFSYGPRICLGKNIALMEIYMLVPTLLGLLDVSAYHSGRRGCFRRNSTGMFLMSIMIRRSRTVLSENYRFLLRYFINSLWRLTCSVD
jgi:cytochrome P450